MAISRYASWLKSDTDEIFFWHHLPENNVKNAAIIIISPIGPEYMSCHRSIKLLAEKIALSGIHCIRYDAIGMGNSSGNLEDPGIWDKWIDSPQKIRTYLKNQFNISEIIFIGLRSGCLILSEAIRTAQIKTAVFWHPQIKGAAYIRSTQLLDSVLYKKTHASETTTMEGGGYPISAELQNNIRDTTLSSEHYRYIENALIIETKGATKKSKLNEILMSAGIKTELTHLDGLDNMIKQVTLSEIPHSNIEFIQNWITQLDIPKLANPRNDEDIDSDYSNPEYKESVININANRKLFGILTTPNNNEKDLLVIFVNTGAAHHAGPNHIHVDTARSLIKYGVTTFRIDISNLGDSANNYEIDPPQEYPLNAASDINIAIEYINTLLPHKSIVLCGISAGAHNIFHAALTSSCERLRKIILINPETYYYHSEHTLLSSGNPQPEIDQLYYQKQFFNYKKWLSLITHPSKLYNIASFAFIFIIKKVQQLALKMLNSVNIKIRTALENDILLLGDKNIALALIYSEGDPGHQILMSQAARTIKNHRQKNLYASIQIHNADHTFSSMRSRKDLYEAIAQSVNKT